MNRLALLPALAALVAFAADAPRASAQPQVPGGGSASRPTFSPYLNLLGGGYGGSPALNYLGVVRPQQQLYQQFGQIQQQQQQLGAQNQLLSQTLQATEESFLPPTGNLPVFNSTGGYFNRVPGITGGGSSYGMAGGFSRPLGGSQSAAASSLGQPTFARPQGGGGAPRR